MKIGSFIAAVLVLFCLIGAGCSPDSGLDASLNSIVKPYRFDIVGWELEALSGELEEVLFGDEEASADESPVVLEYFSVMEKIRALGREIEAVRSGVEMGDIASLESEMNILQEQQGDLERQAEKIIEGQIRETLTQLGIFNPLDGCIGLETGFPPVNFIIEEPPKVLVVSLRDNIESIREITLVMDVTLEEIENIEEAVDGLGVSSLVVNVGGMATYPAFVASSASLRFTINAAIEEWLHQYLFFKPLGFMYALDLLGVSRGYEIAIINETLVGMVSNEIGDILYRNYYAKYDEETGQTGAAEPEFDFNQEMRDIRKQVDEYLARGEIELAEEFMEQKRLYLISQGYYIRKLNQAYFAFYGTYADSPTSIDPIGIELRTLRDKCDSAKDFLDKVALITSRSELIESIGVDEGR
ncbi:hypothetical protein ACFLY3_03690 [Chloroflexota bacterium]